MYAQVEPNAMNPFTDEVLGITIFLSLIPDIMKPESKHNSETKLKFP